MRLLPRRLPPAALCLALAMATSAHAQSHGETVQLPVWNQASGKVEAVLLLEPTDFASAGIRRRFSEGALEATFGVGAGDSLGLLCDRKSGVSSAIASLVNHCLLASLGDDNGPASRRFNAATSFTRGKASMLVERAALVNRRAWFVLIGGAFEPILFLWSLGLGFGQFVTSVAGPDGQPVSYAAFVAPALLAASAMNGAVYDATFNVFFKFKYAKLYDAMLATPMGPLDIAIGEISWALLRGGLYSAGFLGVMLGMGLIVSPWALLALPVALLVAFAFAAVGMAATTFMRSWQDFDLVQLAVLPLFLFSTTFFPLSVYPGWLQVVVSWTPLYHAIELMRGLTLGVVGWGMLGHVAYFAVLAAVGTVVAARRLGKLLLD
jgi:lipooligosaccharide transport system permease protein